MHVEFASHSRRPDKKSVVKLSGSFAAHSLPHNGRKHGYVGTARLAMVRH
jgi:hypothetical protein